MPTINQLLKHGKKEENQIQSTSVYIGINKLQNIKEQNPGTQFKKRVLLFLPKGFPGYWLEPKKNQNSWHRRKKFGPKGLELGPNWEAPKFGLGIIIPIGGVPTSSYKKAQWWVPSEGEVGVKDLP